MKSSETEAIKLIANAYLALRVAYFNEVDMYAEVNSLDSKSIINGICLDSRIGNQYNNPSFGFVGYCLPKDTKQLLSSYQNISNKLLMLLFWIIKYLQAQNIDVVVYKPYFHIENICDIDIKLINNIDEFKKISDVIVANRIFVDIQDVINKVYTRDIFFMD